MHYSILNSPLSPFQLHPLKSNASKIKTTPNKISSKKQNLRCIFSNNPTSRNPKSVKFSLSCLVINEPFLIQSSSVAERVQSLNFEFKSLHEPIDRVKKLLNYATILPPFDEFLKIQENKVMGCTAQVWLDVKMDRNGAMKFRVDSDSEIVKGFCSCLIWVLDGAEASEVMRVKTEDLMEMNVGLPSRGNSRVNTWHNVLISMQKRTKDLLLERNRRGLDYFSSLFVVNGSCKEINV